MRKAIPITRRRFLQGLAGILSAGAAPWVHGTVSKAGLWTPKLIVPEPMIHLRIGTNDIRPYDMEGKHYDCGPNGMVHVGDSWMVGGNHYSIHSRDFATIDEFNAARVKMLAKIWSRG